MFNFETNVNTNVPSLSSSAMLVEVNIGFWSGRKQDKKAAKDIELMKGAKAGSGSYSKKLLGDCPELDAIQSFVTTFRVNRHYQYTHPWSDTGPRLLLTSRYFDYHKVATEAQQIFYGLVNTFLSAYDTLRSKGPENLGELWNDRDYPTVDQLRKKFYFNINYMPLPDSGDFRVDIGNEAVEELKSRYEEAYSRQLEGVMTDVWSRLLKTLEPISKMLTEVPEGERKYPMHRSVFDRAMEIAKLMEDVNITHDPQMQATQRQLVSTFQGLSVDMVKYDSNLKAETKKKVDEILATLPSLDM
jgi:hypothetical protein